MQGREVAISVQENSVIAFYGVSSGNEITIKTLFINESGNYIDIIPTNLNIRAVTDNGFVRKLETYEPESYLRGVKRRQYTALILQGMSNVANDYSAGTSTSTTSGEVYNSYGTLFSYSGTTVTEDESKKRDAQRKSQDQLNDQSLQYELYRNSIRDGMLLKTTLFPGGHIEGNVKFKNQRRYDFEKFYLEFQFGDEKHSIPFKFRK